MNGGSREIIANGRQCNLIPLPGHRWIALVNGLHGRRVGWRVIRRRTCEKRRQRQEPNTNGAQYTIKGFRGFRAQVRHGQFRGLRRRTANTISR